MPEMEEKIYRIIRREGPVLPVTISKKTAKGTMLISAILTSMVKRGKIKRTKQKIGSSSLYYVGSQKEKALKRILEDMEPEEKKVYNLLKDKKVLRDKNLGARKRAIIRKLKDFAKLFEYKGEKYWRFRDLAESEAINLIRKRKAPKKKEKAEEKTKEVREEKEREGKGEKEEKEKGEKSLEEKMTSFLKEKGVEIVEKEVIRKKYEINLVIKANTSFGKRKFFVKVRSKKRIKEEDLSLAYFEGEKRKMPVIFLTDGKLTGKAKEYANKELGSVFKVVKLGEV